MTRQFPEGFWFGSATAAYQIEGAVAEDGRGPSIWDVFSHTPGKTAGGDNGDIACDHYHRWHEDVELMKDLGLDAYRFSISWPRVQPTGRGAPNSRGLDFYKRLVDALREAGIRPVATLYHWDLPQALQEDGGWTRRATAEAFGEYARLVAESLGDNVAMWTTLNEPWCSAFLGHASGVHAPGITDPQSALRAAHHLNLAHGLAAQSIHQALGVDTPVSVTLNLHVARPRDPGSPDDRAAVKQIETLGNDVWLAPMLEGQMSGELIAMTRAVTDWSFVREGDLAVIHQPLASLGINYYSTMTVCRSREGDAVSSGGHGEAAHSPWVGCGDVSFVAPTGPLTAMGWNIDPAGLRDVLVSTAKRFPGLELFVTENGMAAPDRPDASGVVHDDDRIAYLEAHLGAVLDAVDEGAPVGGYFVWSLMDNFEWSWGYDRRFGIIRVDYDSYRRIPKDSFRYYQRLIARRSLS
ncbi:beta-glucosidase [Propionibacterium cyclohexanicum]|uniref:Beta-glucosidase n=1 Tax=Propionibacterium cyclohexanicum TaxID=64702 RepID=A0A1H9SNR1_9ACTN|nr:GH1 family beta-glucosidase [Propionibacterium cyclohexanicum]SER86660.1 beta-glucosidase [Propionibacterium cyclohexanicum]